MKKLTKTNFIEWAQAQGYQLDSFGHLHKETNGKSYRFKLSRIAVRYEYKSKAGWVRLRSGYYSKLTITPEGKIEGMTR